MPLLDSHHLYPTGMRVVAPIPDDDSPYPDGFPELALQRYLGEKSRRRAAEAVVAELEQEAGRLRDALAESVEYVGNLIRAGESVANDAERLTREVSKLRDIVTERDAEIDTLRSMIEDDDK